MVEAARHKWPTVRIIDDNHADAMHLLEYARQNILTLAPRAYDAFAPVADIPGARPPIESRRALNSAE